MNSRDFHKNQQLNGNLALKHNKSIDFLKFSRS